MTLWNKKQTVNNIGKKNLRTKIKRAECNIIHNINNYQHKYNMTLLHHGSAQFKEMVIVVYSHRKIAFIEIENNIQNTE